ncbi:tetratricopeptide repeat protein [Pontiellaceae bacterium B1224]|nr:tetratricopeptide repeat protein [Pontiellaceae bacterium B1224]
MKKWIGVVFGMLAMATLAEEPGFRAFTAKDGRTLEARIVEYDAKRGRIQIERRGAGKVWVTPDVFGEADQAYIKEWIAASAFLADTSLRVSMDKQITDRFGSKKDLREGNRVLYEVSVKNNSQQALEGSRVEYRYFLKRVAEDDRPEGARTISGSLELAAIEPTRTVKLKTSPADVVERYSKTVVYNTVNGVTTTDTTINDEWKDELQGIWIRIYGPDVGGTPLFRDFTEPDDLIEEVEWGEADSPYVEKMKVRGWAVSGPEYSTWLEEAFAEVKEAPDEERAREIAEAFEAFYDPEHKWSSLLATAFYYKEFDEQCVLCADMILESKENSSVRVMLVDLLSSSPSPAVQNGERAVEHALALSEESSPNDVAVLDLLARAYARNGQFALAQKTQEQAIESLKRTPERRRKRYLESFKSRLKLYANGQPYTRGEQDVRLWEAFYTINKVSQFPVQADRETTLKCIFSISKSIKP